MSSTTSHRRRTRSYLWTGALALCLLTAAIYTGTRLQPIIPEAARFWWSIVSGTALIGCIAYQWNLLFARISERKHAARNNYHRHRIVGTASLYLFLVHAGGIGYALLTVLPTVYLAIAVTGLLNSEIVPLRRVWMRRCWGLVHIGLSGLLLPLAAFHIWAALAFK